VKNFGALTEASVRSPTRTHALDSGRGVCTIQTRTAGQRDRRGGRHHHAARRRSAGSRRARRSRLKIPMQKPIASALSKTIIALPPTPRTWWSGIEVAALVLCLLVCAECRLIRVIRNAKTTVVSPRETVDFTWLKRGKLPLPLHRMGTLCDDEGRSEAWGARPSSAQSPPRDAHIVGFMTIYCARPEFPSRRCSAFCSRWSSPALGIAKACRRPLSDSVGPDTARPQARSLWTVVAEASRPGARSSLPERSHGRSDFMVPAGGPIWRYARASRTQSIRS
jgi:hypothetical protein